jgi:hypothetical protein
MYLTVHVSAVDLQKGRDSRVNYFSRKVLQLELVSALGIV